MPWMESPLPAPSYTTFLSFICLLSSWVRIVTHIHAAYTSMMLTHTHSSCIHEDHRSLQPTYSCRPHMHAAHTYMQSTCPCNSHAAHKSMQPIHSYSPHIHAAHTAMNPFFPSPSPIQFQQLIHHAAVFAKGDRVSVTSSQMCISKHFICEVCTGTDGGGQR